MKVLKLFIYNRNNSDKHVVSLCNFASIREQVNVLGGVAAAIVPDFLADDGQTHLHALHHKVLFKARVHFKLVFATLLWRKAVVDHRG